MIFISGDVQGVYRAQNIIKTLLDHKIKIIFFPHAFSVLQSGLLRKVVNIIFFFITLPFRILFISMSDALIVLPMNTNKLSLFDAFLGRFFGKKVIYEYYISLYDANVNDRGLYMPNSFKSKISLFYDKAFTRLANKVVCLNHSEIQYYKSYMAKGVEHKLLAIPLVVDYFSKNNLKTKNDSIVYFCWWGSYIPLHGLELIIESFSLIKSQNVRLKIFGDSKEKSKKYQSVIDALNLDELITINNDCNFKNGLLPKFLCENQTIALGVFGESAKAKNILPNKTIDACLLSIPTVTVKNPATEEFFDENENILYTERTAKGLAEKIDLIGESNYEDLKVIGKKGHKVYIDEFSVDIFQRRYINMLTELLEVKK